MKTLLCALVVAVTLVATAQSASPPIFPVQRPDRLCGPVCLIYCEYGNVLDALGCPTCQCNELPVKPLCRMDCPNGFFKDPDGCPICMCKPVTVPTSCRRQCRVYCAVASLGRTFGRQRRRNEPTGCDCNCPVRPIRPRYSTRARYHPDRIMSRLEVNARLQN